MRTSDTIYYVSDSGGRRCWTSDGDAWWECADQRCRCDGYVPMAGSALGAMDRRQMRYVRVHGRGCR